MCHNSCNNTWLLFFLINYYCITSEIQKASFEIYIHTIYIGIIPSNLDNHVNDFSFFSFVNNYKQILTAMAFA